MTDDVLLTVEEVAKRLSVHVETVRRWIRSGELQAVDLGGPAGYRVARSELDRFIRDRLTPRRED